MYGYTRTFLVETWLALFSVAMLFVAPLIAKSLSHAADCPAPMTTMEQDDAHHHMMVSEECAASPTHSAKPLKSHMVSPMEEIACGYCQLLIHLLFVVLVLTTLLWLLLVMVHQAPAISLQCRAIFRAWLPQRARAPPAVFC
ncbi:MAG: hypothetical protein XXXJIFNMEKO3_00273 [Candidatus Erwinia impunctatus]